MYASTPGAMRRKQRRTKSKPDPPALRSMSALPCGSSRLHAGHPDEPPARRTGTPPGGPNVTGCSEKSLTPPDLTHAPRAVPMLSLPRPGGRHYLCVLCSGTIRPLAYASRKKGENYACKAGRDHGCASHLNAERCSGAASCAHQDPDSGAAERRRGNGLLVRRLGRADQSVGTHRLGYCNDVALPRTQYGGPLHDLWWKQGSFALQALHR